MKVLKFLGVLFLSLFTFIFIFLLSLSLIFKNVVQKGVVGSVVKDVIINEFAEDQKLTDEDKKNIETVNKVIKTEDINELVSKVLDEYEKSLDEENYKVSDKTVDYVIDLLVEYKDLINDISHENITEKEIRSSETREGIEEAFNEILSDHPDNNKEAIRIAVTSYNFFVSSTFRLLMIFFTIVCLLLIALIRKSYTRWMKPAATVITCNGLLISASYFAIIYAFKTINNSSKYNIVINPKYILCLGIIEVVIGIVLSILSIIFSGKKEDE